MSRVLIAGTVRVPPENLGAAHPHIADYVRACREEDGCVVFSFAQDLLEPGLLRIFEIWRDADALERHKSAPHVAAWRALWPSLEIHERKLGKFEIAAEETF
jgi:quinol monooxygenase YgiN